MVVFQKAKNGEETCSVNNFFLHSSYNPSNEASRFVQNVKCDFFPKAVLVTEPVLSYCVPYLKKRFPASKLVAVRYSHFFDKTNNLFDFVFYADKNLENNLISSLSENVLCHTLFLSWDASKKAFEDADKMTWQAIKNSVHRSQAVFVTTKFFEKRWIKNELNFCKYAKNVQNIKKIDLPIVITASGPSLDAVVLKKLKQLRKKYFLLCLSSAFSVLAKNEITPDLVISTDGGYYAKLHLSLLENFYGGHGGEKSSGKRSSFCCGRIEGENTSGVTAEVENENASGGQEVENFKEVTASAENVNASGGHGVLLAIPPQAMVKKSILEKNVIVPLKYSDIQGKEKEIIDNWEKEHDFKCETAVQNGTVAGTALFFALSITSGKVFACGLDLKTQKGHQHALPNELEKRASVKDNRLTGENRFVKAEFFSESLKIYEKWFSNESDKINKRFFRLSEKKYENKLGSIKDVDFDFFEKCCIKI